MIKIKAFKRFKPSVWNFDPAFLVEGQKAQIVDCLTGDLGDSIRPHDLYKIFSCDGSICVHGHLILESCKIDKT